MILKTCFFFALLSLVLLAGSEPSKSPVPTPEATISNGPLFDTDDASKPPAPQPPDRFPKKAAPKKKKKEK